MTASVIPFPAPKPKVEVSACPTCCVTAERVVEDVLGIPVITCKCSCMFFGEVEIA